MDSTPGLERSLRGGNGNPLQYSCLKSAMDRGAWWAAVHGVAKSWTQLSTCVRVHAGPTNDLSLTHTTLVLFILLEQHQLVIPV